MYAKNMNTNKKKKWIAAVVCVVFLCTIFTGCGAETLTGEVEHVIVENGVIGQEHTDMLADFSYDMLRYTANMQQEDILISPLSAWLALTMTGQGANGETAEEFAWFSKRLDASGQRTLAAWVMEYLAQYEDIETKGAAIGVANSVWCDEALTVNEEFIDTVQSYYRAEILRQDLQAPGALREVNDWIADATDDRIQDMLEEIDATAVMLLINALTLDAKWQSEFDIANTRDDIFYLPDGTEKTMDFMHKRINHAQYLHWDGGEGIVLPYQGNNMSMIALMPSEENSCDDILNQLHSAWLYELQENRTLATVQLSLPKFTMESKLNLNDVCQAMGLELAFDAVGADFSGLGTANNGQNIYIGRVLQNCMLEVGEEGTKAAAATVVEMKMTSARLDPDMLVVLEFNRPFVYLILDTETQIPLFTGIYQGE